MGDELEGDGALERGVEGLVHLAHSSSTDGFEDFEVGDGLLDHHEINRGWR